MRVLISTAHSKMGLYKVYKSICDVKEWEKVDSLVFHSSVDNAMDVVFTLNNLPDNVKTRIYVNSILDSLVYRTFTSINGVIYTDEQFLDDAESLDYLIDNVGILGCEFNDTENSVNKLSECINTVINSDENTRLQLIQNRNWVQTLNDCMDQTKGAVQIAIQSNVQMRDFLKTVDNYISEMHVRQSTTVAEVEKLRKNLEIYTQKQSTLHAFGTYKPVVLTKPIIYIRCIGDINYLTTLMLCFQQFMKTTKQRKSKLLLVRTQQYNYLARYNEFYRLDTGSVKLYDPVNSPRDVFITFEPVKTVMDKFFGLETDFFIVIDFLQNNKPLIENTANVTDCLAYGSIGYYENTSTNPKKLAPNRLFFTQRGIEGSNIIPYISEFDHSLADRQKNMLVFKHAKAIFDNLASFVDMK